MSRSRKDRAVRRRSPAAKAPVARGRHLDLARARRAAGPLAIAAAGAGMLAWTWRTWPDPFIDYGREVYLAWQVAEGRTLYRDLAHFNGPLSVLFNALVMRVAGPGILHVALANAAVAAACVAMLHRLLVRTADRTAAALAGLAFVTMFACGRYTRLGNYNWLCPYSYELPHGVALGIATLWCLDRYQATRRRAWLVATGAALGLVALTKTEALLAAAAAAAAGLALTLWRELGRARAIAAVAAGAALPLAAAFVWFVRDMPAADVLAWPLGYWRAASRPEFAAMPMYREGMGLDDVAGNLRRLVVATGWIAVALAPGALGAWGLRGRPRAALASACLGALAGVSAWWLLSIEGWFAAARTLPLATGLVAAASFAGWLRAGDAETADRLALRTALAVLALTLLAKIALHVRVFHYGFALAMPATAVALAALVAWIPEAIGRRGGEGRVFRAVAVGLAIAGIGAHVGFQQRLLARQTSALGSGADRFWADDRAASLRALEDEIRARVGRDETLAILPEGILLSYLTRRASSVRYVQYSPLTVLLWGEDRVLADFRAAPPDFVALVHRDNAHEGARFFGRDYARTLLEFVEAGYRRVWRTGAEPFSDGRFGIVLYQRAAATAPATGSP